MDSQSIHRQFADDGCYLAPGLFEGHQLVSMIEEFDHVADRLSQGSTVHNARWAGEQTDAIDGGESMIVHTHNIQHYSAVWMHALLDPAFLDVAEALLGPDIILHHSKLFLKPPSVGSPFPMHQDWEHFPSQNDQMIAAVIHLSDTDESSGCLRLYPGSHTRGRLDGMRGEGPGSRPRPEFTVEGATPMPARAGDVLFFSYLTVHGSTPNRSSDPRKTVLVQLHPGDDRTESGNSHTNVKLALRGRNHHASPRVMGTIR